MQFLIGKKLDKAVNYLDSCNIKYKVVDNNFNVDGDTTLVTNVITYDDGVTLVTGKFIFDLRKHSGDK